MKPMTKTVLAHIESTYGIQPEFLWAKSPNNAALRHKRHKKWFAALLMELPKQRLGLSGDGAVDVLNVKCDPNLSGSIIDGKRIFPGYHMNKEHWISIALDGSVSMEEIAVLVDMSYRMTEKY